MSHKQVVDSPQSKWARFRFSIIGALLAAPPEKGQLKAQLMALSKKQWTHPISGKPFQIGFTTLERWYYKAREHRDPVLALRTKLRTDAGCTRGLSPEVKQCLQEQYRAHPSWSYQLHVDNLYAVIKQHPDWGAPPVYHTVRRYMKSQGFIKQKPVNKQLTAGALIAQQRLESREVRSFEMDYVHALWHLDFHHAKRAILREDGHWYKPILLAILDDRSRLICHAQWYLDETVETLVHGLMQALQKRAIPRALMTDNGAAMVAIEFTQGLERLGILHQPTLPYSPYQNAKQEVFWAQVEGRLMAMLEGEPSLHLSLLNQATLAWIEREYHHKIHSELGTTPLKRYLEDQQVGRPCPDSVALRQSFCAQTTRSQRKSDGTISLEGKRFEIPSAYRHVQNITIRYARWDLSQVFLVDKASNQIIGRLYPLNKSNNASGLRQTLPQPKTNSLQMDKSVGIAPLLKHYLADFAATGLPPAYLPKETNKESNNE